MKKRLLLILSIVCLASALAILLVAPVAAGAVAVGANGASIQKTTVIGSTTGTSTITVTNNNATATITLNSITDTIWHYGDPLPYLLRFQAIY